MCGPTEVMRWTKNNIPIRLAVVRFQTFQTMFKHEPKLLFGVWFNQIFEPEPERRFKFGVRMNTNIEHTMHLMACHFIKALNIALLARVKQQLHGKGKEAEGEDVRGLPIPEPHQKTTPLYIIPQRCTNTLSWDHGKLLTLACCRSVTYLFAIVPFHYLLWHYLLHISAIFRISIYTPALAAIPILSSSDPC